MRFSFVFAALMAFTGNAFGADSSFYVGLGPSYVTADVDDYSASDFNKVSGFTTTNPLRTQTDETFDGGNSAWRIYGGYQFSDFFAVELGYLDSIGEFERTGNRNSGQTYFVPLIGQLPIIECSNEEYEASAATLSLVGQIQGVFGRIGVAHYDVDTKTRTGLQRGGLFSGAGVSDCIGNTVSSSETSTGLVLAIGARYRFESWSVRAEVEVMNGLEFSAGGEAEHYGLSLTAERNF